MLNRILYATTIATAIISSSNMLALEAMTETQMSKETGAGVAFLPENFSMAFDPDAFIHVKAVGPLDDTTRTAGYSPLDVYTYGLSIGKSNGGTRAANRDVANITSWGTGTNPFVLVADTPTGKIDSQGNADTRAVMSFKLPSYIASEASGSSAAGADAYNLKMSSWADYMSRNTSTADPIMSNVANASIGTANQFTGRLRLQTIWDGFSANGTELNLFQTPNNFSTASQNGTLGITGIIRLNSKSDGVLRMSTQVTAGEAEGTSYETSTIAKRTASDGGTAVVPTFGSSEGLYLTGLNMNIVLGQLDYQPLTISKTATGNNLELELARIENKPAVYEAFYSTYDAAGNDISPGGSKQCTASACNPTIATHSNIEISNISFKDNTGTSTNLGSAKISGMMINHLKITTTGL